MEPLKVLFGSGKGGACKTTLCVNTAVAAADLGYRVLVIDMDSQGDTTALLGVQNPPPDSTAIKLLEGGIAVPIEAYGVQLIATHEDMATQSQFLYVHKNKSLFRAGLAATIHACKPDLVFFDIPPVESIAGIATLAISDFVVISLLPHERSFTGAKTIADLVAAYNEDDNKNIKILGVVPIGEAPTKVCQDVVTEARKKFGDLMTEGIPWRTVVQEASAANMPVKAYEDVRKSRAKHYELKGKDWHIMGKKFASVASELIDSRIFKKTPQQAIKAEG